jgi:hypothetical protein
MVRRPVALAVVAFLFACPRAATAQPDLLIDARSWQIMKRDSGPVNYYSVVTDPDRTYLHARYLPPWKTAVVGYQLPEEDRRRARHVKWSWRAVTLPTGGDECASGKQDSAAVVYLTWKRGLRYYALKYVWSAVGQVGKTCDTRRNPFVAQDTVILESGGPVGTWRTVDIDLAASFRAHFENGDPTAEVPDFVGIGLMSDGDQTRSESAADFGTFIVSR